MENTQVKAFVGSARVYTSLLRETVEVMGLTSLDIVGQESGVVGSSRWLSHPPGKLYNLFKRTLSGFVEPDGDTKSIIWCAGGGTGAARVASLWTAYYDLADWPGYVLGSSDCSVYPLMAYFWHSSNCYYAPNLNESPQTVLRALDELHRWGKFLVTTYMKADAVYGAQRFRSKYKVLPACTRTLYQVHGLLREALLEYLASTPVLLMLEDNYPPDSVCGPLALYEDLTNLHPFLSAVSLGGGAVTFSSLPYEGAHRAIDIIRDYHHLRSVPTFSGVDFGHTIGPKLIIPYGCGAELRYNENSGLSIKWLADGR